MRSQVYVGVGNVEGDYGGGNPPVHYAWSPTKTGTDIDWETGLPYEYEYVGEYENETVTLDLSNLPKHTHLDVWIRNDAFGPAAGPVSSMSGDVDGAALVFGPSRYEWEEYWYQTGDPVEHEGDAATISVTGAGFAPGWTWRPAAVYVDAYFPTVALTGGGTTYETDGEPLEFT
ncbi:MAG: hypothetical protein WBD40_08565, partial [Tepidisphaeraceae bacterium]